MTKKFKMQKEWILYKGEEFISTGTIKEISEETGKSEKLLKYITNPVYKKRIANRRIGKVSNAMIMIEVEEDGELQ